VKRVIVAEDDDEMRYIVADAFRRSGYKVFEARDGGELLACIAGAYLTGCDPKSLIDLVVTDNRMPGCSGLEVLRSLRKGGWTMPVIVITGFADELRAELGALDAVLLVKPFRMADLRNVSEQLLARGRSTEADSGIAGSKVN